MSHQAKRDCEQHADQDEAGCDAADRPPDIAHHVRSVSVRVRGVSSLSEARERQAALA